MRSVLLVPLVVGLFVFGGCVSPQTPPEKAKIAIANRIARAVYKILCGEKYKELGYMRGDPHEQKIKHLVGQLKAMGVNVFHHNHQMIVSEKRVVVEKSGIILN